MSLLSIDLFLDQYADYSFILPAWLAGGVPVDYTGATATLKIRANPTDTGTPLVSISTTPSSQGSLVFGPVVGGATGDIPAGAPQINIAAAQLGSAFNAVPLAYYDLDITFANGKTTPFASGRVLIKLSAAH